MQLLGTVCLLFYVLCNVIFFFTEQVQLIEFGGVLDSCGLRSIWDKITSQNTTVSPCSSLHTPATHPPLFTPAPHSSLHQSVFRYTHRTSANAPLVRAIYCGRVQLLACEGEESPNFSCNEGEELPKDPGACHCSTLTQRKTRDVRNGSWH